MQINLWLKDGTVIYLGGDPKKNEKPLGTITMTRPQILIDEEAGIVVIKETK